MARPKPEPLTDQDREYAANLLAIYSDSCCKDEDCVVCKIRKAEKAQQLNEQKHDVQLNLAAIEIGKAKARERQSYGCGNPECGKDFRNPSDCCSEY